MLGCAPAIVYEQCCSADGYEPWGFETEEAAWWDLWGLDAAAMWGAGLARAALGPPRLPSFPPPPPLPQGFPSFTSTGTATLRGELALCNKL